MTGRRRTASLLVPLATLALLSGCAVGIDPQPSPSATTAAPTQTPSPEPTTPPLTMPDTEDPDQIAAVVFTTGGGVPSSESITGPATMAQGARITVTGECRGSTLEYELRTAAAGEEQRLLLGATIGCAAGPLTNTLAGVDFAGPVQLAITNSDGVDEGWVQALREPVG